MEAFLSSASVSSENIEDGRDSRNRDLLPAISTTSLRHEISEELLQDDASPLSPSDIESNSFTRHNALEESASSPQGEPLLQQDPCRQGLVTLPRQQGTHNQPEDVSESSTASFQEWALAEAGRTARKLLHKPHSWKEKLGTFAIVGLIAGSILLCAAVGTLAFIWFGSSAIPAWKEITARNWLSKAVSICVGVIQQVMMLQLGIVTATLASLALESKNVVIGDVASVSAMRATATSTGAFVMTWQYVYRGSYRNARHSSNIFLLLSAALLWCLSQFLLLIILTDVSLRSTAGVGSRANLPYNIHYNLTEYGLIDSQIQLPSAGPWNRKISTYSSFAEYSEPPYEAGGVSDTGVTLRAFLPFGTAQARENLESYKGKSTVLDARVTCQVPQIKNATIGSDLRFRGSLAPTRNTPRLVNLSLDTDIDSKDPAGKNFDCFIQLQARVFQTGSLTWPWPLSLCQLRFGNDVEVNMTKDFGGLYSEFQNLSRMDGTELRGSEYLFLNITVGPSPDFRRIMIRPGGVVAEASQERGEWLDLIYANGSVKISASICYAAFDFADIDVSISSQSNRTESRLEPVFDGATSTYTFQELRYAMGQDRSLPLERRGLLELAKRPWQVARDKSRLLLSYYLRETADLRFTYSSYMNLSRGSTVTGLLFLSPCPRSFLYDPCVTTEEMHIILVQEILRTNGSIAFALQTMITLLSSMAYYDQMGQFDKRTHAEVTFFETAQVPVGCVGFAVVTIIVVAHCILVAYCVSLFLRKTTLSRLGASWSAVAQVATGDVMEYLGQATQASDNDIQARLKADGKKSSKVCLEEVDGQISMSIVGKDEEK